MITFSQFNPVPYPVGTVHNTPDGDVEVIACMTMPTKLVQLKLLYSEGETMNLTFEDFEILIGENNDVQ